MDETIDDMPGAYDAHQHVAQDLVDRARSEGVKLVGLGGLLTGFTKSILDYDVEIRRVSCSTNAIESLNARYRRAVRARGHFPTERAGGRVIRANHRLGDAIGRISGGGARVYRSSQFKDYSRYPSGDCADHVTRGVSNFHMRIVD
jgi:hypothetical protein